MRVADKGNVADNVGIIMMMITNNYFTQDDGWGTHPTKGLKFIVWVNWPQYKVSFRLFHARGFHEPATELLNLTE